MKLFNIIWCVLFILFAALQYNDPDPYVWMPIYLYAAVFCWLAFRGRYYPKAYLIGIGAYLAYAIYLFIDKDGVLDWAEKYHGANIAASMQAEKPWIEQTREFFGLVITMAVLAIDYLYAKRKMRGTAGG